MSGGTPGGGPGGLRGGMSGGLPDLGSSESLLRQLRNNFRIKKDPNAPKLNLKLLKQAWELTYPFWTRKGAWRAYIALGLYAFTVFGFSLTSAYTAKLAGEQLNALSTRNGAIYYHAILLMLLVTVGVGLANNLLGLPYNIMMARWRQWLTERFIKDYLTEASYYVLNRDRVVDNPDERIAIDIEQFVYYPTSFVFSVISCVSDLVVFGAVLWHFGWYLMPVCAGYYIAYSGVSILFAVPQMKLGYEQRRLDGDFRFGLVNVRTNAESVAFLRGEPVERKELFQRNALLIENAIKTVWWNTVLIIWLYIAMGLNQALPSLLIAPMVLRGTLTLAAFPQATNAWQHVGSSFGIFGQQAQMLAYTSALIARLHALREHCVGKARKEMAAAGLVIQVEPAAHLSVERLTLETPRGERTLVADLTFDVGPAGRLIVVGRNGVGKSSLLRGFAGLWTRGTGRIGLPPPEQMIFLPQRPYMSLGTLREQVTYPESNGVFSDEQVRSALAAVNLPYLEKRFDGFGAKLDWTHVLSPGEQQRMAFARTLLRKPRLVILDEATSGLDTDGERRLYQLLQEMDCSYISVAHRVTLFPFHDTVLELTGEGNWAIRPVSDADLQLPQSPVPSAAG